MSGNQMVPVTEGPLTECRVYTFLKYSSKCFIFQFFRSQGAFIDSSRLYALQGALAQQEWRVGQLLNRLLDFLKQYLTHPYQARTFKLSKTVPDTSLPGKNIFQDPLISKSNLKKLKIIFAHECNSWSC